MPAPFANSTSMRLESTTVREPFVCATFCFSRTRVQSTLRRRIFGSVWHRTNWLRPIPGRSVYLRSVAASERTRRRRQTSAMHGSDCSRNVRGTFAAGIGGYSSLDCRRESCADGLVLLQSGGRYAIAGRRVRRSGCTRDSGGGSSGDNRVWRRASLRTADLPKVRIG